MSVETIEVDPRTRIRVEYDTDAEDPRWWGDHITDDDEVVQQWRAGEVYGVIVERKVDWARVGAGDGDDVRGEFAYVMAGLDQRLPDTMSTWEEVDSIWGCYLDNQYTARMVAHEYFGVTLE